MIKWLILLFLIAAGWYYYQPDPKIVQPPGILAPYAPVLSSPGNATRLPVGTNFTAIPLMRYQIEARVLAKEPYFADTASSASPYDIVFGWMNMSDSKVLDHVRISQLERQVHYSIDGALPVAPEFVRSQSSNMHIVPGGPDVKDAIANLRIGQVIRAEGYLIHLSGPEGFNWRSAVSTKDKGEGATEVFWIERMKVVK